MTSATDSLDAALQAVVETITGNSDPPGRRTQVSVAYCRLVIDHHCGIAHLLDLKIHGSAFALARPTFEALVKGLWLFHCADDDHVERHALGKELAALSPLLEDLQGSPVPPVISRSLQRVKTDYWKDLSSLAHVGHTQVRHWLSPDGVPPNYPEAALNELANFASFMVLAADRELALRAGNERGAAVLLAMLPEARQEG